MVHYISLQCNHPTKNNRKCFNYLLDNLRKHVKMKNFGLTFWQPQSELIISYAYVYLVRNAVFSWCWNLDAALHSNVMEHKQVLVGLGVFQVRSERLKVQQVDVARQAIFMEWMEVYTKRQKREFVAK